MNLEEMYEANKKNRKKARRKEIIGKIFFGFWMFILMALMLLTYIGSQTSGGIGIPLVMIGVWILLFIVVLIIRDRKSIFRKKKALKEFIILDPKFGEMKFIRDINDERSDMKCKNLNIPFGRHDPEIAISGYREESKELYFRGLEYVYELQDEIIDNLYGEAKDTCDNWDECDKDGNPITYDYIKENFTVSSMDVRIINGEVWVRVWGWPGEDGLLGHHNINAEVNCSTKEIDYLLEG